MPETGGVLLQHPEGRIIPQRMYEHSQSGGLVPAGLLFELPAAGAYMLIDIDGHPFLDPYDPLDKKWESSKMRRENPLDSGAATVK